MNPNRPSQKQTIGWFTASCVLVSNIIGGGVFTTTGVMARDLGDSYLGDQAAVASSRAFTASLSRAR